VALRQSYFFVLRWQWYEWLGLIGPVLLFWWLARLAQRRKMENIERRLDLARGGPQTQKLQKEVVARMAARPERLDRGRLRFRDRRRKTVGLEDANRRGSQRRTSTLGTWIADQNGIGMTPPA
jgi:hypothetical protein